MHSRQAPPFTGWSWLRPWETRSARRSTGCSEGSSSASRDRRWFPAQPKQLERAQAWFQRYGVWSLLFAWLPVIGEPLTVVAGAMRVHIAPFLILVAIGKGLRYVVLALAVEGVVAS